MQCHYCNWHSSHHEHCPNNSFGIKKAEMQERWQNGYNAGRRGEKPTSLDRTWRLGWVRGTAALEESEN